MSREGFGKRFLAILIDAVILVVVIFIITFVLPPRLAMIVSALIGLAYGALDIVRAQTVGKMVLGMKITKQDGSTADPQMLVTRYAVKYSASIIGLAFALLPVAPLYWLQMLAAFVVFIGCLLALRSDKLALHDIVAHTAVFGGQAMPTGFPVMTTPAASERTNSAS